MAIPGVKIVVLDASLWEASELKAIEKHVGVISPSTTYKAIVVSRTPGGTRWYSWWRPPDERWLVVATTFKGLIDKTILAMTAKVE